MMDNFKMGVKRCDCGVNISETMTACQKCQIEALSAEVEKFKLKYFNLGDSYSSMLERTKRVNAQNKVLSDAIKDWHDDEIERLETQNKVLTEAIDEALELTMGACATLVLKKALKEVE